MTYCQPFPRSAVTNWNERSLDCSVGEWGVDVGLQAGTLITAPFSGSIQSWQPCCPGCTGACYCWGCASESGCGRLCLGYGPSGEAIAFGHIKPLVTGGPVSCGQAIGVVQQDACGGPHTEFQYFPDGNYDSCGSAVNPISYLNSLFNQPPPPPPPVIIPASFTTTNSNVLATAILLMGGATVVGAIATQHPALRREWTSRARHEADHAGHELSSLIHTARRRV